MNFYTINKLMLFNKLRSFGAFRFYLYLDLIINVKYRNMEDFKLYLSIIIYS